MSDTYGLDAQGRTGLLSLLDDSMRSGGRFVQLRVEAGDPNFILMWEAMGGMGRYDRRRAWWSSVRDRFERALR